MIGIVSAGLDEIVLRWLSRLFGGFQEVNIRDLSGLGGCQVVVSRLSVGLQEIVRRLSGGCQEVVRRLSEGCYISDLSGLGRYQVVVSRLSQEIVRRL